MTDAEIGYLLVGLGAGMYIGYLYTAWITRKEMLRARMLKIDTSMAIKETLEELERIRGSIGRKSA